MDYIIDSSIKNNIEKSITKYKRSNSRLSFGLIYEDKIIINGDNDIYDVGSISKVFTSLLFLEMSDNHIIDINDRIDKYIDLPEGTYPSLKQLLSHETGYYHLTPIGITFFPLLFHRYKNKNVYDNVNEEMIVKEIIKRKKRNSYKYGYSDFSYAILAIIATKVYKKPFNEIMNDYLKRVGLSNSVCIDDNIERISKKNWKWNIDNPYIAAGGIASKINDMVKIIEYEFTRTDNKEFEYNKNHNLTYFTTKKGNLYWHVGGVGYFRSAMLINPKRKIGVVVLGNNIGRRGSNPYYLSKLLYTAIRRNKIIFR